MDDSDEENDVFGVPQEAKPWWSWSFALAFALGLTAFYIAWV